MKNPRLKKGAKVVMVDCDEAELTKNMDKVWTCLQDSFLQSDNEVVFLDGYSGGAFPCNKLVLDRGTNFQISDYLTDSQARQVFSRATGSSSCALEENSTIERYNGEVFLTSKNLCYKKCDILSSGAVVVRDELGHSISTIRTNHVSLYYKEIGILDALLAYTHDLCYQDGRTDGEKFSSPTTNKSYWLRCVVLGNRTKDKTEMFLKSDRFVIYEQSHPIAFIYENRCVGTPEIVEAILSMFENQIKQVEDDEAVAELLERL